MEYDDKDENNALISLVDELAEDICFELVFEFDEQFRTSSNPEELIEPDEIEPVIDIRHLRFRSSKDFLGNEVVNAKYPEVSCPNCERNVIVTKLSWHMSRCMFPNSGRAAALRARKDDQNEEDSDSGSRKRAKTAKKPKRKLPNELLVAGTTTRAQRRNGRRGDFLLEDTNIEDVKPKTVEPLKIRIPKEALDTPKQLKSPLSPRAILRKPIYKPSYLRSYLKNHMKHKRMNSQLSPTYSFQVQSGEELQENDRKAEND